MCRCFVKKFIQPFAHLLATPTNHGPVVNGQGTVRNHQMLVYADNLSESFASRASSDGGVERKHLVGRFFESDAVCFELGTERKELCASVRSVEAEHAGSVPFIHGRFGRVGQTAHACLVLVGGHAVYQQVDVRTLGSIVLLLLQLNQVIFNAHDFAVHLHACKALLHVDVQLFHQGATFTGNNGCKYCKLGSFGEGKHTVHNVFGGMFLDQLSADRRIGLAYSCKKQAQVFVNFR